jgi:hypothetical protein
MAKTKKSAKKASSLFHNIMEASVKGNPMPSKKKPEIDLTKPGAILKHIQAEVEMVVADWDKYSWLQISMRPPHSISYFIGEECPADKHNKIEKTIIEQVDLIGIHAEFHD